MKQCLFIITLIFMAPQIHALSEQHDVNTSDTDVQSEQHDARPADTQSEQHDVNQSEEAEKYEPADAN